VEEALQQVKKAGGLARQQGGPAYFDKMIASYEKMLEYIPDDNRIRYTLAWAYYMKAYVLSKTAHVAAGPGQPAAPPDADPYPGLDKKQARQPDKSKKVDVGVAAPVLAMMDPKLAKNMSGDGKISTTELPRIPSALEQAPPSVRGQVKSYYDSALKNLDDLLARKPDDVWARVYRAHLYAESTGDLATAMRVWKQCAAQYPQNPAAHFFMAEGNLRLGNLKDSLGEITKALMLRGIGM
jgi:tetratricopeptide (TPR) repeat protein